MMPKVGPEVRIRLPPAASHERTLQQRRTILAACRQLHLSLNASSVEKATAYLTPLKRAALPASNRNNADRAAAARLKKRQTVQPHSSGRQANAAVVARDDERIDDSSEIVSSGETQQRDRPGNSIDLDLGDVRVCAAGEV